MPEIIANCDDPLEIEKVVACVRGLRGEQRISIKKYYPRHSDDEGDIIARFGMAGLLRVKKMAHSGKCFGKKGGGDEA